MILVLFLDDVLPCLGLFELLSDFCRVAGPSENLVLHSVVMDEVQQLMP